MEVRVYFDPKQCLSARFHLRSHDVGSRRGSRKRFVRRLRYIWVWRCWVKVKEERSSRQPGSKFIYLLTRACVEQSPRASLRSRIYIANHRWYARTFTHTWNMFLPSPFQRTVDYSPELAKPIALFFFFFFSQESSWVIISRFNNDCRCGRYRLLRVWKKKIRRRKLNFEASLRRRRRRRLRRCVPLVGH